MKLAFLEFIDEANLLIRQVGIDALRNEKEFRVICFHPKVKVFLRNQGILAEDTIDYLSTEAQHRIILRSEEATLKLMERFAFQDSFGISKGYEESCIHHLRLYVNHLLWVLEILNNAVDKYSASQIIVCTATDSDAMYTSKGYIQDEERFLGLLAQDFCKEKKIDCSVIPWQKDQLNVLKKVCTWGAHTIAQVFAYINYQILKAQAKDKDPKIVVPAISYRMDHLLKEIRKDKSPVHCYMIWEGEAALRKELFKIYFMLTNFIKRLKKESLLDAIINLDLIAWMFPKSLKQQELLSAQFESWDNYIRNEERVFSYKEVSFSKPLADKIKFGLKKSMLKLEHYTVILAKIFKQINPQLVMSMYSSGIYYMMGELGEKMHFKTLNISHGTHVPPNNEFEKIENYRLAASVISNTYRYVAVQTPWTNRFLDYYKDGRERLLTGPLLYSKVNPKDRISIREEILGENREAKVVIHATTQKTRDGLRFHITETLDEYISSLVDIVNVINNLENTYLIIRPHPVCNLTDEEFSALLPACKRVKIISKGSFSKVLSAADLLISYSSTCIEEAIENNIPVILYDKWKRYNHFNISEAFNIKTLAPQPAYYSTSKGHLQQTIEDITSNDFNPKKLNGWSEYKYPSEYKMNFFKFVEHSLERKGLN